MARTTGSGRARPEEPRHLRCTVCSREIPGSVALSHEGPDYIYHFCGIECMEQWRAATHVSEEDEAHPDAPHRH